MIESVDTSSKDIEDKDCLLRCLAFVVRSKELMQVCRNQLCVELQNAVKIIEQHSSGGPLHVSSGILTAEVNAVIGFN